MNNLHNILKKSIANNAGFLSINRGPIFNSFSKLNSSSGIINNSNSINHHSNNSNNNNINNNCISRFYSTISPPTSVPKLPVIFYKRRPTHYSKSSFDKITSLVDQGSLTNAQLYVVRCIRKFKQEVDISSSLFSYPLYVAGLVSLKMGRYAAGENFLRTSYSKYTDFDNSDIYKVETLNNLGLNLLRQGRTDEAEKCLFNSSELAYQLDITELLPNIFTNIGEFYKELCYFDRANFFHGFVNSLLISNQIKGIDLARCFLNRAQIFRLSNKIKEAESFLDLGGEMLIRYFREKYPGGLVPKHMDWSKLLLEVGHLYYAKGEILKAKNKFTSAYEHFHSMKNSSVPDAVLNLVNLAIIEHNHKLLVSSSGDISSSSQYIINLLNEAEPLVKELKSQTSNLTMSRVNSVVNKLQKLHQPQQLLSKDLESNNNNVQQKNNKASKPDELFKLFEPQHFQLTFVEKKLPFLPLYNLKV